MKTTPDTPKPTARTVYALDVPLGGNRVLRCTLDAGEDGPGPLRLLIGWNEGAAWRQDRAATAGEAVTLPAEAIGPLRAALCALVLEAKDHTPAGD
jgi:hypothetical protein